MAIHARRLPQDQLIPLRCRNLNPKTSCARISLGEGNFVPISSLIVMTKEKCGTRTPVMGRVPPLTIVMAWRMMQMVLLPPTQPLIKGLMAMELGIDQLPSCPTRNV
jgi:hypothetical protein